MILRRITGRTMAEALARVEKEIGRDALIIESGFRNGKAMLLVRRESPSSPPSGNDGRSRIRPASTRAWPEGFRPLGEHLLDRGLSDRVVGVLLEAIRGLDPFLCEKGDPSLPGVLRKILGGLLKERNRPEGKVMAMVGPTGVGKTTTLAKLAARAVHERGERVAILTTDTFRIAAVDQLKAFADMCGASFRVVFSPADLREALKEAHSSDRVYIDTTGRSPKDAVSLQALRNWFKNLPIDVHLCLPCTGKRRDLLKTIRAFGVFRPDAFLLTKWDETENPGEAVSLMIEQDLPLSFVTDGQRVPEDIRRARPADLARTLLPMERA